MKFYKNVWCFSPTEESLLSMSKYMKFRDLEDEKENTELLFREFWVCISLKDIYNSCVVLQKKID